MWAIRFPHLVEHDHNVAGEVEIALGVESHAVGAKFAMQALIRQRTVGLHVVGVDLESPARQWRHLPSLRLDSA